ncbi:MAG: helix-turn-helix transcriptional regulator [Pseudomonadota bacterium]
MEMDDALAAFAALSQQTRLETFRLLVKAGGQGLLAGEIADKLGVLQNTLSSNLNILSNAGLIRSEREGRAIRYFIRVEGMRGLLAFLLEDCCGGRPELCQPLVKELVDVC